MKPEEQAEARELGARLHVVPFRAEEDEIARAGDLLGRLVGEVDKLRAQLSTDALQSLTDETQNRDLVEENQRLREALRFYAEEWERQTVSSHGEHGKIVRMVPPEALVRDRGSRARSALNQEGEA